METGEVRTARSAEGIALLATLPRYRASEALALAARLRKQGFSAEVIAQALTQARLRDKAADKFGEFASGMLFTPEGLEQATRLRLAALHARRFIDAGIDRVADVTCGIGADAMALSALGIAVMAFEEDEATALVAEYNLRHWLGTIVVHADSMSVVREVDVDGVFADPARRTSAGARRHRPEDYRPRLDTILALQDRFPALGIKVGPGIPHSALPQDAETEWVSVDGRVAEAGIWCGPLARRIGRGALLVVGDTAHRLAPTSTPALSPAGESPSVRVGPVEDYLYEPDGAVIRAGLVGEIATITNGHLIDATIAYVTSPSLVRNPFATPYRILDNLPFNVKGIRAYLKKRGVGRVTIKKRGTAVTPEKLRSELRLTGDAEATLVLTRVAGSFRALVVETVLPETNATRGTACKEAPRPALAIDPRRPPH